MISKLRISNFALIEHLELDLKNGFTIVTGETGSGKSILLNAFSLMLGERASTTVVGSYSKKAVVEIQISSIDEDKSFFEKHNLDIEQLNLVRREVVKDGKSRAFINDTPVSLAVLKEFTINKLLIHSQYNTYELKSKRTQLELYDSLTGHTAQVHSYTEGFNRLLNHRDVLNELVKEFNKKSKDTDYNKFLLEELGSLRLDHRNYKQIESELFKLENADEIREALFKIQGFNEEQGVYSSIKDILKQLDKLSSTDSELGGLYERLKQVSIDIKEISNESGYIVDSIEDDQERKTELLNQLDEYNRVLLKHKVGSQEELQNMRIKLSSSTEDIRGLDSKINELKAELQKMEESVVKEAESLHLSRLNAQSQISNSISKELISLKLPHTDIYFEMNKGDLNDRGITQLNLLFSANLGHPKIEIEKAASGGELSRFMLALLKLISESKSMPTILFDEIDSGVSGDVANKIGQLLKNMGVNTQLLVISHLPQVAAKAKQHLMVHKQVINKNTVTSVEQLNEGKRIKEIARLMSGENVTKSAIETAKSLMN